MQRTQPRQQFVDRADRACAVQQQVSARALRLGVRCRRDAQVKRADDVVPAARRYVAADGEMLLRWRIDRQRVEKGPAGVDVGRGGQAALVLRKKGVPQRLKRAVALADQKAAQQVCIARVALVAHGQITERQLAVGDAVQDVILPVDAVEVVHVRQQGVGFGE